MNRESFIFYKSFYYLIKLLKPKEQLKMYEAIFNYGFDGVVVTFENPSTQAVWNGIYPQLRANQRRYENGLKGKESGVMGGRPKNNPKGVLEITPNKTPNVNENENENDNVNVFKISKKESKEIDFKNNNTQARESYEEIMEEFGVSSRLKPTLWEFIQHCLANGHVLTNSKLEDIIIELDKSEDESAKITMLKRAISGGYYDVLRLNS